MLRHVLSTADVDVNIQDSNGWTALHHACKYGDIEIVKIIVKAQASINKFSNTGFYPIHIAALNNNEDIIEYLVKDLKDEHGDTIKGADLESQTTRLCTPLHLAAKKGNNASMKTILELGGNIYARDHRKWTALHYAAFHGHSKSISLLCKWDAETEKLRAMKNSQDKRADEIIKSDRNKHAFISKDFVARNVNVISYMVCMQDWKD